MRYDLEDKGDSMIIHIDKRIYPATIVFERHGDFHVSTYQNPMPTSTENMVKDLWKIDGIYRIYLTQYSVTIHKGNVFDFDKDGIAVKAVAAIKRHIGSDEPLDPVGLNKGPRILFWHRFWRWFNKPHLANILGRLNKPSMSHGKSACHTEA